MTTEVNNKQPVKYNPVRVESSGNVVNPPTAFVTQQGDQAVSLTLACNNVYNGKEIKTWYIECVFMRECAIIANSYRVGDLVNFCGLLQPSAIKPDGNNSAVMIIPIQQQGKVGMVIPTELAWRKPVTDRRPRKEEETVIPQSSAPKPAPSKPQQMDIENQEPKKPIKRTPNMRIMRHTRKTPQQQDNPNKQPQVDAIVASGQMTQDQISNYITNGV